MEATLQEKIIYELSRKSGLTELEIAKAIYGVEGYQQMVNGECRHMRNKRVLRREKNDGIYRYFLMDSAGSRRTKTLNYSRSDEEKNAEPPSYLKQLVDDALEQFLNVALAAGVEISVGDVVAEYQPAPHHSPKALPPETMAVYAFFYDEKCFKCGKVGLNSSPRFVYQHYSPKSAPSTLAASILKSELFDVDGDNVGTWIKHNMDRVNFIVAGSCGPHLLSFLESFLHLCWKPKFEGHT